MHGLEPRVSESQEGKIRREPEVRCSRQPLYIGFVSRETYGGHSRLLANLNLDTSTINGESTGDRFYGHCCVSQLGYLTMQLAMCVSSYI